MLPNIWRFPAGISGWLTEAEGRALALYARGKDVLEIGAYHGRSTVCMAQTAHIVHTVDWGYGDEGAGFTRSTEELLDNLRRLRHDNVIVHVGRSENVLPAMRPGIFDFVFVDGAHDEAQVTIDLMLVKHLCRPSGLIALHDWNYPSVQNAAKALFGWTDSDKTVLRVDSLYIHGNF